jgi:3-(3-hydroxy-phenyl)propionate hydroxylase
MDGAMDAEVIIVGCGPVGLTLANLLGRYGVRTHVVERNGGLEPEPRAVTLDDESLRTLQGAGLVDAVVANVVRGYGVEYFDWRGKPFAAIQPTRQEYGYPKRNAFRQPLLVRTLFEGLARFPHVQVSFGQTLHALAQDGDGVCCTLDGAEAGTRQLRARFLVACDGGRSTVRELCGITLDGSTYPERWLIVDLARRTVPLRHTRTYCDPRRPAIRLPGPGATLRYEFMLRHADADEHVLDERTFRRWIAERVPEDAALRLVRKAIYGFHARLANRWNDGRVLLAGDAAHLTPPFAGQGLNSGIRDAANLAWKLAAVLHWNAGPALLDSYEQERRPHAAALIRMALRIGAYMQPKSVPQAFLAQTALRLAFLVPACRDYVLQLKFKPKPRFAQGWFLRTARHAAAELLPQPAVERADGSTVLLDALLGDGFAVIGWDTPAFRAHAQRWLPAGMPGRVLALVPQADDFLGPAPAAPTERVRDVSGALGELMRRTGAAALVVRPDRYTYRAVSASELAASPIASLHEENNMEFPCASRRLAAIALGCTVLVGLLPTEHARAQTASPFPSKPVRALTAFPAGSGPDAALRVVAEHLSKKWGQPVVVENRPGGNGFIAINAFKQAAPDGHELIQLDSNHLTTHPHTFSKLPYHAQKDLEPVRPLFRNYFFIVVSKDSPYKSLEDIVAAARAQPGAVTYGSWSNGSPGHLGALCLQQMKGVQMVHVPYKEMGQLYSDVATSALQWALGSAASAGPLEKAGKLRFIAIAGPQRSKLYPQVPSVAETPADKGYTVSSWTGLFAPKGTPKALREKINADVLEVLRSPDVVERFRGLDYEMFDADPDAFAQAIVQETRNWAGIIAAANLKLD